MHLQLEPRLHREVRVPKRIVISLQMGILHVVVRMIRYVLNQGSVEPVLKTRLTERVTARKAEHHDSRHVPEFYEFAEGPKIRGNVHIGSP